MFINSLRSLRTRLGPILATEQSTCHTRVVILFRPSSSWSGSKAADYPNASDCDIVKKATRRFLHSWQLHSSRRGRICHVHCQVTQGLGRRRMHHGSRLLLDALHRCALLLVDRGPKGGLQVCAEALEVSQGLCKGLESSYISCKPSGNKSPCRVVISKFQASSKDVVA